MFKRLSNLRNRRGNSKADSYHTALGDDLEGAGFLDSDSDDEVAESLPDTEKREEQKVEKKETKGILTDDDKKSLDEFTIEMKNMGRKDLFSGKDILFNKRGEIIYEGEFKNDQYHGQGVLYFKPGVPEYMGTFEGGLFHGAGIKFNEAGEIAEEGIFQYGKLDPKLTKKANKKK